MENKKKIDEIIISNIKTGKEKNKADSLSVYSNHTIDPYLK
jgi:hypothetical protein